MERGKNYNEQDKQEFLTIISNFKSIIENKKTDGITNKRRMEAWTLIADQYNSLMPHSGLRSIDQLRMLYKNLKKKARKDTAADRIERYKTGGGTYTSTVTNVTEMVQDLMKGQLDPLPNQYDSNAAYMNETTDEVPQSSNEELVVLQEGSTSDIEDHDNALPMNLQAPGSLDAARTPSTSGLPKKRKADNLMSHIEGLTNARVRRINMKEDVHKEMHDAKLQQVLFKKEAAESEHAENLKLSVLQRNLLLKDDQRKEQLHNEQLQLLRLKHQNEKLQEKLLQMQIMHLRD